MKVDTDALRATAVHLRAITQATVELGARSGAAVSYVPAVGLARPAQALDSFLSNWVYGVGCIGSRAHAIAEVLTASALAVEAVEELLRRELAGAEAAPASPGPASPPTPTPEPVRPAPVATWGLLGSSAGGAPQLSQARHARDLIPGDPEQVKALAQLLDDFTNRLMDCRHALHRSSLGGWNSRAAGDVVERLNDLLDKLTAAVNGFGAAGAAVKGYAAVHAEAREQAFRALMMWQQAEHESQVFRGLIPGQAPPAGVVDDPGLYGMAAAARLLAGAREAWEAAAKKLEVSLADAETGAPTDPGALASVTRAISSFGAGVVQGTVGIAEGVVNLAALGYGLSAASAVDPDHFRASWEAVGAGVVYLVTDFEEVAKSVLDVETFKENPALWAGKFAPEVLLAIVTAGAAGSRSFKVAHGRLRATTDTIELRNSNGLWDIPSPGELKTLLDARGLTPGSPERSATHRQLLRIGPANADHWYRRPLREGQRIAVYQRGGVRHVAVVSGDLTRDAREFFEGLQLAPRRALRPDGSVGQPEFPATVEIYEVRGDDVGAAHSRALANPQYGHGGSQQAYVPDLEDAIAANRLVKMGDDHAFEANSTRSDREDPLYREADSTLPERPLDPEEERRHAERVTAGGEAGRAAFGAAAAGIYDRAQSREEASVTGLTMTEEGR